MHQVRDLWESDVAETVAGDRARLRYAQLTPRERELLALMAAGLTNEAIGRALWLSPKTVESHVRSILGKLVEGTDSGCHRRVAAVLVHIEMCAQHPDAEADARPRQAA
jgi:DNA-binding CsgD family transcriptional regulator